MAILNFLLERLKEKSTWATFIALALTVVGMELSPEQQAAIATAGTSVIAAIAVFTKEA
jgi:hypothetical protein